MPVVAGVCKRKLVVSDVERIPERKCEGCWYNQAHPGEGRACSLTAYFVAAGGHKPGECQFPFAHNDFELDENGKTVRKRILMGYQKKWYVGYIAKQDIFYIFQTGFCADAKASGYDAVSRPFDSKEELLKTFPDAKDW